MAIFSKTIKESSEEVSKQTESSKPDNSVRKLKKSVTWQRITVALLGIGIEVGIWQWATWHLYVLPTETISSFTTITVNCFYVIAALVIFFVTGKLIYDLKVDTVANVITEGKHVFEHHEEKIEKSEHVITDENAKNENLKANRPEETE